MSDRWVTLIVLIILIICAGMAISNDQFEIRESIRRSEAEFKFYWRWKVDRRLLDRLTPIPPESCVELSIGLRDDWPSPKVVRELAAAFPEDRSI